MVFLFKQRIFFASTLYDTIMPHDHNFLMHPATIKSMFLGCKCAVLQKTFLHINNHAIYGPVNSGGNWDRPKCG